MHYYNSAPQFSQMSQCRVTQSVTLPNGDQDDDTIPVFTLEGNRRVHGIGFATKADGTTTPFLPAHLHIVLTYLYTGRVPPPSDTEAVALLRSFGEFYGITSLKRTLPQGDGKGSAERDAAAIRRAEDLQSDLTEC